MAKVIIQNSSQFEDKLAQFIEQVRREKIIKECRARDRHDPQLMKQLKQNRGKIKVRY